MSTAKKIHRRRASSIECLEARQMFDVSTTSIAALPTRTQDSNAQLFANLNGQTFFVANKRLFVTDGTPRGTRDLGTVSSASSFGVINGSSGAGSFVWQNRLYFAVQQGSGYALISTDGTVAGTATLALTSGLPNNGGIAFATLGNSLFVELNDSIYRTDGTSGGTQLIQKNTFVTSAPQLVRLGEELYFSGSVSASKTELFAVNAAGVKRLVSATTCRELGSSPGINQV